MLKLFDGDRVSVLIDLLKPARRTRIVDVGANPGNEAAYTALLNLGQAEVWGFEPDARSFAELTDTDTAHFLPWAVGDGSTRVFHINTSPFFSSVLPPDMATIKLIGKFRRATQPVESVSLTTVRLDDMESLPEFDLLKIDVQGAEVMVFEGAKAKLAQAVAVISEVAMIPLYEDQPLLDAQMAELRKSGLEFYKFLFMKGIPVRTNQKVQLKRRAHSGQAFDGDAVFLRSLRHFSAMSSEQLKHLAILADAVFEGFDVALFCLDRLIERGEISADAVASYAKRIPFQIEPPSA